jgi:5-methyltetrahydrofolate--homocysteine methyltransferase
VGLSGLLVKSAQQMVITANDMSLAHIHVPILVGGAALTENFTNFKIAPAYIDGEVAYASDAMSGLELAKQIVDPEKFTKLKDELREKRSKGSPLEKKKEKVPAPKKRSPAIPIINDIPNPPDFDRHILKDVPIDQIWNFMNPRMLYSRHLGMKGSLVKLLENEDAKSLRETDDGVKALEIKDIVQDLQAQWKKRNLRPKAVYQFFEAASEDNLTHIYSVEEAKKLRTAPAEPKVILKPLVTFDFPRQAKPNGLCLSDYINPIGSPRPDNLCFFVVTAGEGIRDWAAQLKDNGEYLKSHVLQALALETAEALAEYLHSQIRSMWGFGDPVNTTMLERFQARYRGKRYSFGYPACPILDDQVHLFKLIRPEDIGVELTDGFMMDPEASVSAIVFHHPAATYYGVGDVDRD